MATKKIISQADAVKHFESLVSGKAIYLWGANCEKITAALCTRLYNSFKSNTYNKAYYDGKLKEGAGRIGADCSGAFYGISKNDRTAAGYYKDCTRKGKIANIPAGEVVAVFNSKLTHIGLYCGNGYTIEMKSSKDNVHKEKLNKSRWAYYGYLDFVDYSVPYSISDKTETTPAVANKYIADYQKWLNATYKAGLEVDGYYGADTLKASVKAIQSFYNEILTKEKKKTIAVDGSYGDNSRAATPSWSTIVKNTAMIYIILMRIYAKKISIAECVSNCKVVYSKWETEQATCLKRYQGSVRGLTVDGKPGQASMYSLFHV